MSKRRTKRGPSKAAIKHTKGQGVLLAYGYPETITADREECYRLLATLGYHWDTRLQQWAVRA